MGNITLLDSNPNQMVLFPELFEDTPLPPITSMPDFDNALDNLVRLADFGAFIEFTFHGIDKSYIHMLQ